MNLASAGRYFNHLTNNGRQRYRHLFQQVTHSLADRSYASIVCKTAGVVLLCAELIGALHAVSRCAMTALTLAFILLGASWITAWAADPPCDKYPVDKQTTCAATWKALNHEDGPVIAQFGLDQLKRREEGKITAEQHLAENMAFIKQSTDKRLERLKQRMAKE